MLVRTADAFVYGFTAMASPCEVIVDALDQDLAEKIGAAVEAEAARIEHKFSRYRADSVVARMNASAGGEIELDAETAGLIDYAAACHQLSDGLFDITSGVLRRVWRFDGSDKVPSDDEINAILPLVGWRKVGWRAPRLWLAPGMEIDLGGLGKEYAVDRAIEVARVCGVAPVLVNFGGDLRVTGPRREGKAWRAAIESVSTPGEQDGVLVFYDGAVATSGDAQRFLLKDGVRYGHILDPRTGWPVRDPPRSVTVAAPTCMEAGLMTTMAMLHGAQAEAFLRDEGAKAWVAR